MPGLHYNYVILQSEEPAFTIFLRIFLADLTLLGPKTSFEQKEAGDIAEIIG